MTPLSPAWLVRAVAGALLIVAGAAKLRQGHHATRATIAAYEVLPRPGIGPAAALLPALELVLGTALLLGDGGVWVVAGSVTLYVAFAAAVATNLLRGRRDLACGCFGRTNNRGQGLHWGLVLRNLLLAIALAALPALDRPLDAQGAATAVLLGTAALVVARAWAVILVLRRQPALRERGS